MVKGEKLLQIKSEEMVTNTNKLAKLVRKSLGIGRSTKKKRVKESIAIERHCKVIDMVDCILDNIDDITGSNSVNNTIEADKQRLKMSYQRGLEEGKVYYTCLACPYGTGYVTRIRNHIQCVHERVRKYVCNQCEYRGCSLDSLRKHHKSQHPSERECWYMDTQVANYYNQSGFAYRRGRQNGKVHYTCLRCSYNTSDSTCIKYHVEGIHERVLKYSCDQCEFRSSTCKYLSVHKKKQHLNAAPN